MGKGEKKSPALRARAGGLPGLGNALLPIVIAPAGLVVNWWRYVRARAKTEHRVRVLVLGYPGAGKTILMASLFRTFTRYRRDEILLRADPESEQELKRLIESIEAPGTELPEGTRHAQAKRWEFTVAMRKDGPPEDAFVMEYYDYPGGYLEDLRRVRDAAFLEYMNQAHIVMGLIDGEKLRRLLAGPQNIELVRDIENLLRILVTRQSGTAHLVITKWDLVRRGVGRSYDLRDVLNKLDAISDEFKEFRETTEGASMRIIPVAALGTNGFVGYDSLGNIIKHADSADKWVPYQVEDPFFCALPDAIEGLMHRKGGPGKPRREIMGLLSAADVKISAGPVSFKPVPAAQLAARILTGPSGPSAGRRSAIMHVLRESYKARDTFDHGNPHSRVRLIRSA